MMSVLRKTLVVSLFVLLSAVLFTAFVSPAHDVFVALCRYQAFEWLGWYSIFVTSWVSVTAGLSLSATAAVFLLIGLIIRRRAPKGETLQ